uniref:Uncharacterized protein n=1 Tax=Meloidogyne floridensis TaxID=298350 RepID=A0A915NV06_9BILA
NECVEKGGKERCLNGGKCLDQLNGYRCECPKEWFGNYCEFNLCDTLTRNNNCSYDKQENVKSSFLSVSRMERANNDGKRTTNTFLSVGQWPVNNFNNSVINGEISFHFATNQSDGTMFWLGDKDDDSFILLELVRGRLRAAVQLGKGHEPYSQLYSMNIVSDSKSHWLVIGIYGQKFYLTVDDFPTQFAINTGPLNFFPNEFLQIYFGGVPADLGRRALVHFIISDASSIIGCFWDLRFNQISDIENNILPYPSLDLSKYINVNNTFIGECNN